MLFVASMLRETNHRRRRTETQDLYVLERSFRSAHPRSTEGLLNQRLRRRHCSVNFNTTRVVSTS
jgi:hypothetical protein